MVSISNAPTPNASPSEEIAMATNAGRKSEQLSRENRARHPARRVRYGVEGRIAEAWSAAPKEHRVLARELAEAINGEVRFDIGSRALYSTDASNYRQIPIGVVVPRTVEDAVATVEICRRHDAAVLPRGGGTSLAGECCNVAVVIDFSKYLNRVIDLDPAGQLGRVEPGCILDELRGEAEKHDLTFGPDPATHGQNTLGGMIGNNSGGVHAVMAGITVHNVHSLDLLTYDGIRMTVGPTSEEEFEAILAQGGRKAEIYRGLDALRRNYGDLIRERYPDIPRRVSGYENLDQLLPEKGFNVARALVGTEGTCVTVLGATLNLIDSPKARVIALLGFPDVFEAADAVPRVLEFGPIGLEGMDRLLVANMRKKDLHVEHLDVLPRGNGWLIAEFGADSEEEAAAKANRVVEDFDGREGIEARIIRGPGQQARLWKVRESGLGATAYVPGDPDTWEGWEDTAVHRDNLGDYLRELRALFHKYGYESTFYGHFGDGLVHCRIDFHLRSVEGLENWRRFLDEAADLVVRYNGSFSGEHGDGQAKAALLEKMYGPELMQAFREFKSIWDPAWKMNPGKVIDPFPITSNLRIGPGYQPPDFETHFDFADDKGMFAHATRRCVGVGKCRVPHPDGQVMCPSFQATREEKHSTRGRSRLLYEMVHGGAIESGWRSDAVEDALSLCLACKGCRSDCPVKVDMATYKAEFRAHHYAGRLRPRAAYSVGLIYWWSRLAGAMPGFANALTQTPGIADAVKWMGGIARERQIPRYAKEPFTRWFGKRPKPVGGNPRVLLWPDTFNNYFRPETAIAATRVLEAAGYEVAIPPRPLCCGRPLYDWGMLYRVKRLWRQTFDALREDIEAGVPLVGLEPACVSAFRDELVHLFPDEPLAKRLSDQTLFFSEFLNREEDGLDFRQSGEKALVQVHCHHHAVIKTDAERALLDRIGTDYEIIPSGCCGMAGGFGFEADKLDVSLTIAEQAMLPRIRAAPAETLIIADGFSCREQIEQATGRATFHVAELVARGLGL
jgi:FAD/FMN-containing dehydrogenase/Fe-S oxidoreductase